MSEWSPDSESSPGSDGSSGEGETPMARVVTAQPVRLRLVAVSDDRAPAGSVVFRTLGVFEGGGSSDVVPDDAPVLAQGSLPEATFAAIDRAGVFAAPVPLLLAVRDDGGGLSGVLFALVPQATLERLERAGRAEEEPWLTSVGESVDDAIASSHEEDASEAPVAPFALGAIVRFAEDRRHPGSLNEEAVDLMASLLMGRAMDANQKRVDHLLRSL
jgi:hypothetical protein